MERNENQLQLEKSYHDFQADQLGQDEWMQLTRVNNLQPGPHARFSLSLSNFFLSLSLAGLFNPVTHTLSGCAQPPPLYKLGAHRL